MSQVGNIGSTGKLQRIRRGTADIVFEEAREHSGIPLVSRAPDYWRTLIWIARSWMIRLQY